MFKIIHLKKGDVYTCSFISGGGTEYDEGKWRVKTTTDKSLALEKTSEKEVWDFYEKGEIIKCSRKAQNPLIDNEDGTFTIYPNQSGTPFTFKKMT